MFIASAKIVRHGKKLQKLAGTAKIVNLQQNVKIKEKLQPARSLFSTRTSYRKWRTAITQDNTLN